MSPAVEHTVSPARDSSSRQDNVHSTRLPSPATGYSPKATSPPSQQRSAIPGAFDQVQRPLSPGTITGKPRQIPKRSISPGPYGAGARARQAALHTERRRSNSTGALNMQNRGNTPADIGRLSGRSQPGWRPPQSGRPGGGDFQIL